MKQCANQPLLSEYQEKRNKIAMEASSSFSEECSEPVLDNEEKASSDAGLAIHGDGMEQEQIENVTAVQDDGRQERVSYKCKICNRSFSRADNMKTHMLTKHLESAAVFCCNACGKLFKSSEGLEKHLVNNYCSLQCDSCAKTFKQKVRLNSHRKVCMDRGLVNQECNICGTLFLRKFNYERHKNHMKEHDGSYRFFCHWCGIRFCTFEMGQQHHREINRDTQHIRKSFKGETEKTRWWERSKAMAKKNDDDPESDNDTNLMSNVLDCEFCGTRFRWKADLKKHKKEIFSSEGSFKFKCELCGDFSCTGKQAKAHFSSKHRNFECLDCGQVFNKKQHLNLHSKMKMPYQCSDCGKMFCNRQSFTRHMGGIHFKLLESDWN